MNSDWRAKSARPVQQSRSAGEKTRRELIGAAALALDVLVVRRRRRFRMKDLHPALQA